MTTAPKVGLSADPRPIMPFIRIRLSTGVTFRMRAPRPPPKLELFVQSQVEAALDQQAAERVCGDAGSPLELSRSTHRRACVTAARDQAVHEMASRGTLASR